MEVCTAPQGNPQPLFNHRPFLCMILVEELHLCGHTKHTNDLHLSSCDSQTSSKPGEGQSDLQLNTCDS